MGFGPKGGLSLFDETFPNEDVTSASRRLQEGSTKPPWGWVKPSRRLREGFSVSSRSLQRPRRFHEALVKTLREGATASPLRECFMKAPWGLHEAFAKTSRKHSAKVGSKGLRDCSVRASRSTHGVSAGSRLRDGTATSSRRDHYGGFMNPSFEAFVDPSDGFHDKPRTSSNREGQYAPPEAWIVGEPRM